MRGALKKNKNIVFLVRQGRKLLGYTPETLSIDRLKKDTPDLIRQYFQAHQEHTGLQIGCQDHPFPGWLNVDIEPKREGIGYMDATTPFPFKDQSFDYVFSEHMIEHIDLESGIFMLKECFRVMKKGGRIRIGTPNLKFLIELYNPTRPVQDRYIDFSSRYFSNPPILNKAVVINNFFRDWGHQFIYDEQTLHEIFRLAGFTDIETKKVFESNTPHLANLEKHQLEITDDFNLLESIVVEGTKP